MYIFAGLSKPACFLTKIHVVVRALGTFLIFPTKVKLGDSSFLHKFVRSAASFFGPTNQFVKGPIYRVKINL